MNVKMNKKIEGIRFMITMGYARVSTKEQNLDRQIVKFKELGIEDRLFFY